MLHVELTLHEQLEDPLRDISGGMLTIILDPDTSEFIEVKAMVTVEVTPIEVFESEAEEELIVEAEEVMEMERLSIWK